MSIVVPNIPEPISGDLYFPYQAQPANSVFVDSRDCPGTRAIEVDNNSDNLVLIAPGRILNAQAIINSWSMQVPPWSGRIKPIVSDSFSIYMAGGGGVPSAINKALVRCSTIRESSLQWSLPQEVQATINGPVTVSPSGGSMPVSGTVTSTPSGTQQVSGTVSTNPPAGGTPVINPSGGSLVQSPASGSQYPVGFGSLSEYTVTCNASIVNPANGTYNTLNVNTPTGPGGAQGIGPGTNTGGVGPYWIGAMSHLSMIRLGFNLVSVNNVANAMSSGLSVWVGFSVGTTLLGPYQYLFSEGFALPYNANGQANYQEYVTIFSPYPLDVVNQVGSGAHLYPIVFVAGLPGGGTTNVLTVFMNLYYS